MKLKELKAILNSNNEWDEHEVCVAIVDRNGMGCTEQITHVVIDGCVYIGNDPEGCDYKITKAQYYCEEEYEDNEKDS